MGTKDAPRPQWLGSGPPDSARALEGGVCGAESALEAGPTRGAVLWTRRAYGRGRPVGEAGRDGAGWGGAVWGGAGRSRPSRTVLIDSLGCSEMGILQGW